MYQAILPLRGKILNVERARLDRVLGNEEVRNIITAVGNGIGEEEDPAKRRYGKVVMMSDADVDGSHIRTLLMTFFYRQMPRLVAEGHLYVAQPPLYMLAGGKKGRRYVQTEEQMQGILMSAGLADAALVPADAPAPAEGEGPSSIPGAIDGERLKHLVDLGIAVEHGLRAFGRRNRSLREFLAYAHPATDPKADPRAGLLPLYLVEDEHGKETPYWSQEEYEAAHPASSEESAEAEAAAGGVPASHRVHEFLEVKTLNKSLAKLRDEYGLRADSLLAREVTGDEPPPRFILHRDGEEHPLLDLRALAPTVRKLGEKGIKITRFKGLGEMDAEQLWETTMDPSRRTLMQVRLDDVAAANDLFTTLMGDDVEPRRDFIEKHALEVKNLDV
jgi:DNA gyrase subunit B